VLQLPFGCSLVDPNTTRIWERSHWLQDAGIEWAFVGSPEGRAGLRLFGKPLPLSEDTRRGLEWARQNLTNDAVFLVNVQGASAYAGRSEARAYLETIRFHVLFHRDRGEARRHFLGRRQLQSLWRPSGLPGILGRLRKAGITHLFLDRSNGRQPKPVGRLVFDSPGFSIYETGVRAAARGSAPKRR
jgi:hypothetical protein